MAQWRIKEISDLTKISVRMLRHYDKIGLLKPSTRTSNNYRWYSEQDLAKLQQIIALKFFGFDLSQIKTMVQQKLGIAEHLRVQKEMLKGQAENLRQAQEALETTLQRLSPSGIPDWNDLILLIERYRMNEELKETWAGKTLNEHQLAEYAALRKKYPKEFDTVDKLIKEINEMRLGSPDSPAGEQVVKVFMDIAKKTKESMGDQLKLNSDIMRSIKEGVISDLPLTPEGNTWFAKATMAYWLKRWEGIYQDIVKNLKSDPAGAAGKKIVKAWRDMMDEQFTGTSPDFVIGTIIWQEMARQNAELADQKTMPTAQEMIKKVHIPLFFNPEALCWIEKALKAN